MRVLLLLIGCFISFAALGGGADVVLPLNRSEVLTNYRSVASVSSDNTRIARAVLHSKGRVSIVANGLGSAYINLMSSQGKVIKRLLVQVIEDLPGARKAVRLLFPNELGVQIDYVNGSIILSGDVSSVEAADGVEKVAKRFLKSKDASILNLMKVRTSQQVALTVRVGEIKRSELMKIGFKGGTDKPKGDYGMSFGVNGFDPVSAAAGYYQDSSPFGAVFNWFTNFIGGTNLFFTLDLLEQEGAFKVLARPTLTAISGENATFMAGGELPIAIFSENGTPAIDYKPFGVMLDFSPVLINPWTVKLQVSQEVSEINPAGSIVEYKGYRIPAISTRKASTTVHLAPGESLMIAGLMRTDVNNIVRDVPGIAKLPVIGALFRSVEFAKGETELVIAVTPHIVNPLRHNDVKIPQFESAGILNALFLGKLYAPKDLSLEGAIGYILD